MSENTPTPASATPSEGRPGLYPDHRYLHDNQFRVLVDYMEKMIREAQFTPSEIRDAAMLAAIHYEMRRPFPAHFNYAPNIDREGGAAVPRRGGEK